MNRKYSLFTLFLWAVGLMAVAAPNTGDFINKVIESGYIHQPLPLDTINSLDARHASKPVLESELADWAIGLTNWETAGPCHLETDSTMTTSGNGSLAIRFASSTNTRAVGSPDDPDYALYGHCVARCRLNGCNLERFNRIAFDIRPEWAGNRVVNINLIFNNSHSVGRKDGYNDPTGAHLINLRNGQWNNCVLEIEDLQRDCMDNISFSISLNGRDLTTGDSAVYYIDNIRLEKIDKVEKLIGWIPDADNIVYSMTGYDSRGSKFAVMNSIHSGAEFKVINCANGKAVKKGKAAATMTSIGNFSVIDFSDVKKPGDYQIVADGVTTRPFKIGGTEIWHDSQWKVLNFIFCQRCGYPVPGVHSLCHTDLFSVHGDATLPYSGGWHDAGDLSQQTLQTGDLCYSLLEAYNRLRDSNKPLAARLLEEARWGLEFILRNRYGDGYRASSMGLLIWQDGVHDGADDIHTVRVQNASFDNYLYSAYEAYASMTLDSDPQLSDYLIRVACEDFDFAEEEFEQKGLGGFISPHEHSYCTSLSQMHATISWAASLLYKATEERRYADLAASHIKYVIDCQQAEPIDGAKTLCGFFYRDKSRKSIVHFIHQSREQIYMQALDALCSTQPAHKDKPTWEHSMKLYGNYLKTLMQYTAPYGMIPGGVYADNEYEDVDGFYALHLFPPSDAEKLYSEQLKLGIKVGEHHYVKRFPVWFNIYNGNLAIHTSMGKAAAICGRYLHDDELTDIAREQLYWIVGKNPFRQSLIYGEGHNYPQMNSFSSGEITGEMPVGIRTIGNTDEPYWPQINQACYKEVWVTSAGKWLSLLAEL